jgi:5-methylcytosine-specific restriction endonuclease McrA
MAGYEPTSGRTGALRCVNRQCVECGQAFETTNAKTLCCGALCGKRRGKRLSDITRSANATARLTRTCEGCRVSFVMRRPSGKARRGEANEGKFCSRVCAHEARRKWATRREQRKATKARHRARARELSGLNQPVDCKGCGTGFVRQQLGQLYCSASCRATALTTKPERACSMCGVAFTPVYGDKRRTFCSPKCLKKAGRISGGKSDRKRARRAGVRFQPVQRAKVFDRDGWRCQVCGASTPKRLKGKTHPRSPELDHRIPLAMGGEHTYENCQLACRKCNREKGGTRVVGQLPLFATL